MTADSQHDNDVYAAALEYLAQNWQVLPIAPIDTRLTEELRVLSGKLSSSLWSFFYPIRCAQDISQKTFRRKGIGIRTGKNSNLFILDIDGVAGTRSMRNLMLPETRMVKTGSGFHLYFKHPGDQFFIPNSPGLLADGIDVKGEDAYVVAPPTMHATGSAYQWVDPDVPLADIPADLLEEILLLPHRPRWKLFRNIVYNKYIKFPLNALTGY